MLAAWPQAKPPAITKAKVKSVVLMGAISQEKRRPEAPFGILVGLV